MPETGENPVRLAENTWPSVPVGGLVLVPVGSTEQHGPHLPLSTDTVIARCVAERAAAVLAPETAGPVLVAPAIEYGASGEHGGFPGTISIGHEALHLLLVELVRSLTPWAWRVVFVNGHGGNLRALGSAVGQLRGEGQDAGWVSCEAPGGDAHAGFTETSVMLHLAPELVRMAEAVPGDTRPLASLMPELVARGVRGVSPTGVLGDPSGADAERGRELVRTMVASVVRRIDANRADARGHLLEPADRRL
ncbi:mycofactocin biosynthesis peptidyl-dipeptidase MftE [Actinocorallia sp. B10E7]|uniref:mycofactocin biosynthesis peptidyl-dipeptidase MftE n=1 Tax=Actinocorallia sp. B10E7 TaxID=3153558 RepID=UPI00325EB400